MQQGTSRLVFAQTNQDCCWHSWNVRHNVESRLLLSHYPSFCVSEHISNLQLLIPPPPACSHVHLYPRGCRVLVSLLKTFSYCFANLIPLCEWNPATLIVHKYYVFIIFTFFLVPQFLLCPRLQIGLYSNFTNGSLVSQDNTLYYYPLLTFPVTSTFHMLS